jgi:hypothetical protein
MVQNGPDTTMLKSSTRIPSSGPIDASGKTVPRVLVIKSRSQVMLIVQPAATSQLNEFHWVQGFPLPNEA